MMPLLLLGALVLFVGALRKLSTAETRKGRWYFRILHPGRDVALPIGKSARALEPQTGCYISVIRPPP